MSIICQGFEDCTLYRLVGLSSNRRFFIVTLTGWEQSTLYWVSRSNGKIYEVYDSPHLSPDGKHIVTAAASEMYDANGVFLWEIKNSELTEKFRFEPTYYALYSFERWLNPDTAELKKFTNADKTVCPKNSFMMDVSVKLIRKDNQWKLDESLDSATVVCK